MKRQPRLYIDMDSLVGGVDVSIYGIAFLILLFLLFVSWLHERCNSQRSSNRSNTLWHLLLSLFPENGSMWPNQFGATRKMLMATGGFGILILSSLYQAKLSEQLLIPYPPPDVTLADIQHYVTSGKAQLLVESDAVRTYVSQIAPVLSKSMKTFTQMKIECPVQNVIDAMDACNTIYIDRESAMLDLLAHMSPNDCENYVFVPFDEWTRLYLALIIRKERADILESMNIIVAERMRYVDNNIQSFQLNKVCHDHIFHVYTSNPKYESLQLLKITGAMAFLFTFLCMSVFVLFAEILYHKWCDTKLETTEIECQTFYIQLHMHVDNTFSNRKRQEMYALYTRMLELQYANE
jgi:hypothetical protein